MNNGHARKLTFTDAQIAEMERLYLDGYSTKAIGDRFGCLMGSVWRRLRDRGVALRKFNERGAQSCARPRRAVHGYVVIGHRYAHRLIAETMLGRPLRRSEHVHHKNGDKTDNRPENLEILTERAHHEHHMTELERDAVTGRILRKRVTL